MTQQIKIEPLNAASFAPFGDVLEALGTPDKRINQGFCGRFHDRAQLDFGSDGRAGISIFQAQPRHLPYQLDLLERHPDGSQAFIPMSQHNWLVIAATDCNGAPVQIRAFLAAPGQGINFHRGIWHGVLTPLHAPGLFTVIDRIGDSKNLQEHSLNPPIMVDH